MCIVYNSPKDLVPSSLLSLMIVSGERAVRLAHKWTRFCRTRGHIDWNVEFVQAIFSDALRVVPNFVTTSLCLALFRLQHNQTTVFYYSQLLSVLHTSFNQTSMALFCLWIRWIYFRPTKPHPETFTNALYMSQKAYWTFFCVPYPVA